MWPISKFLFLPQICGIYVVVNMKATVARQMITSYHHHYYEFYILRIVIVIDDMYTKEYRGIRNPDSHYA